MSGFVCYKGDGSLQVSSDLPIFQRVTTGTAVTTSSGFGTPTILAVPYTNSTDIVAIRIPSGYACTRWYTDTPNNRQWYFINAPVGTTITYDIYRSASQITPTATFGLDCFDANGHLTFSAALDPMLIGAVLTGSTGSSVATSGLISAALNNYSGYTRTDVDFEPAHRDTGTGTIIPDTWIVSFVAVYRSVQNNNGTYQIVDMEVGFNQNTYHSDPGYSNGGTMNDTPYGASLLVKRYVN
ncbi:MAG: hypothetical protein KGJ57_18145 [Sphingomonadales bacterium]|nr:hypothetical protein [Sphingomonadales bacterium]MDE2171320.1 hypothetical protein [Sphingomonadales bacterium]